jgi:hypothetical protein
MAKHKTLGAIMKNVSVTMLLLLGTSSLYSQNYDSIKDSWDKIIILDRYSGWSHFSNELEIKRLSNGLVLVNKNDSVLNKIDQRILDRLFNSLTNDKEISKDPLIIFGKDSIWLIDNAEKLWFSYLGGKNEPAEIDSFAISIIKDYKKVKRLVWSIQGSHWTDDYPFTSVLIIKKTDTLRINSSGQYPFMMPWNIKKKTIFNSGIPTTISDILPVGIKSNRQRLSGDRFSYYLIDRIYESFIEEYRDYFEAKQKYSKQFSILEKYYTIDNAALTDMSSIEWGGFISAPCLELVLKSKNLPDNISFSVIYGRRIKLHSIKPIIRKDDKLIARLSSNRVYQYTLENSNATGEIHFVNKKSLSGHAKRNFKSDLKDNGMKKNMFRGRFRHAIFYELTEDTNNGRSFSRWIFLKDGTNILWEIKGNFLMDLNQDIVKEKGYVCRIITNKDWDK